MGMLTTGHRRWFAMAAVLLCAATAASADPLTIVNFSFETDTVADGNYIGQHATGWAFTGFASTYNPSASEIPGGAPNGFNVLALSGGSTLSQTLTATLEAFTDYTLTTWVGERTDIASGGYTIALDAGANQLASDSSTIMVPGGFIKSTVRFGTTDTTPGLGQALSLQVTSLSQEVAGVGQTEFDYFQLDATPTGAPEPTSFLLFGTGAAALAILRRRSGGRCSAQPHESFPHGTETRPIHFR